MPLPSLTKTWSIDANNSVANTGTALTTGKNLLVSWVARLIAMTSSSWVCYYSCKGAGGGVGTAGDGVNRWAAAGDIVYAAAGSNHSWMVLRNTATGVQVCLDCINNNSTLQLSIVISPSAGFTGGSVTARPTATDEWSYSSATNWGFSSLDNVHRFDIWQSTDGQCTRLFFASAGNPIAVWFMAEKFNASVTGFTYPYYFSLYAGTSPTFANLTTVGKIRHGSVTGGTDMLIEGNASAAAFSNATYGTVPNSIDGAYGMWPVGFAGTTASLVGRMGSFYDLWVGSSAIATGDRYPLDTDPTPGQFIQIGNFVFPWLNNTTALALT